MYLLANQSPVGWEQNVQAPFVNCAHGNRNIFNISFGANATATAAGAAARRGNHTARAFDEGRGVDLQHEPKRWVCCW